jgi:hypothetical protein
MWSLSQAAIVEHWCVTSRYEGIQITIATDDASVSRLVLILDPDSVFLSPRARANEAQNQAFQI